MPVINGVPLWRNVSTFYIENKILTVKHIYNYNIGYVMSEYVNNMTPDAFDNLFSSISDIHLRNARAGHNPGGGAFLDAIVTLLSFQ